MLKVDELVRTVCANSKAENAEICKNIHILSKIAAVRLIYNPPSTFQLILSFIFSWEHNYTTAGGLCMGEKAADGIWANNNDNGFQYYLYTVDTGKPTT